MSRSRGKLALMVGLALLAVASGCASPRTGFAVDRPAGSDLTAGSSQEAGSSPEVGSSPGSGRTQAPSPQVGRTGGPGDQPPNAADNNAWKRRHQLSEAEQQAGDAMAARISPAMEALRAAGTVTPEATRQALLDLGYQSGDIQVTAMRPSPVGDPATPAPGAVYAVRYGDVGCVVGDVRPERVQIRVTGSAAEFGCVEPYTH